MRILGIETSCDETAVAIVKDGKTVLSSVISSSKDEFADMGGVIPEQAARRQIEYIIPTVTKALLTANCSIEDIDAIAVTTEPGLLVSLLVGRTTARTLASIWQKPLLEVHHTYGHLCSVFLDLDEEPAFPCLALSVSGGHTELWHRTSHAMGTKIAETRDDAVGEAFDKGAAMLGLPYPGGPSISRAAATGNPEAYSFPSPLKDERTLDWSFSGLKTALKYTIQENTDYNVNDIAASYENALCAHLVNRLQRATSEYNVQEIHVVGGVSANATLRRLLTETFPNHTIRVPKDIVYCTDNGAMIASAGYFLQSV